MCRAVCFAVCCVLCVAVQPRAETWLSQAATMVSEPRVSDPGFSDGTAGRDPPQSLVTRTGTAVTGTAAVRAGPNERAQQERAHSTPLRSDAADETVGAKRAHTPLRTHDAQSAASPSTSSPPQVRARTERSMSDAIGDALRLLAGARLPHLSTLLWSCSSVLDICKMCHARSGIAEQLRRALVRSLCLQRHRRAGGHFEDLRGSGWPQ